LYDSFFTFINKHSRCVYAAASVLRSSDWRWSNWWLQSDWRSSRQNATPVQVTHAAMYCMQWLLYGEANRALPPRQCH